jgi:Flp pilus assembly secretin CpaC
MMRFRPRLQFRIATLLWLMACVASFFGGRHWDQIAKAVCPKPRVIFETDLHMLAGGSTLFDAHMPVTRMTVADPTIASVQPVTQSTFQVTAKQTGTTRIQLWSESTNQTAICDVSVIGRSAEQYYLTKTPPARAD